MKQTVWMACVALWALTACTEDVTDGQLPDGKVPLQIGGITVEAVDATTRVTEKADGSGSVFEQGDRFVLTTGGNEEITYQISGSTVSPTSPGEYYWNSRHLKAWSPAETQISLADQTAKLAYLLRAEAEMAQTVTLSFSHQLAKVRIVFPLVANITVSDDNSTSYFLNSKINSLSLWSYTQCTNNKGNGSGSHEGWIAMRKVSDGVYEANVVPGLQINKLLINGKVFNLSTGIRPDDGGKLYTLNMQSLTMSSSEQIAVVLGETMVDILTNLTRRDEYSYNNDLEINDNRTYIIKDFNTVWRYIYVKINNCSPKIYVVNSFVRSNAYNSEGMFRVDGGSPEIIMSNSTLAYLRYACAVQAINGAQVTIRSVGRNNIIYGTGGGMFADQTSTLNIVGKDRNEDWLKVYSQNGCAIGTDGDVRETTTHNHFGTLNIRNITLRAEPSKYYNVDVCSAPAIGSIAPYSSGWITIDNATLYAVGSWMNSGKKISAPAIGSGVEYLYVEKPIPTTFPTVKIKNNSIVHAYRGQGGYGDFIGLSGRETQPHTFNHNTWHDDTQKKGVWANVDATSRVYTHEFEEYKDLSDYIR